MNRQASIGAPAPGYGYGPVYRQSRFNVALAFFYIALGRPRSFARDSLLALRQAPIPPLVRGEDRLPETGPFIVVANHYERPGLWMAWAAGAISNLVMLRAGQDLHWIAIQEWEQFSLHGIPIPTAVTRALFERAFRAYGIIAMPPASAPVAGRAAAMRSALRAIKKGELIGLMPEGDVGSTPELLPAREGAGTFLLLLAGAGAPIVPVGLYEEEGRFVTQIGDPFTLSVPADLPAEGRDLWARERVMHAIRDLLPPALWGVYRSTEPG